MKLLSTTILASAAFALATSAQAGGWHHRHYDGLILNEQINLGDVKADLEVTQKVDDANDVADYTDFTLTAAAIGNNLSVELKKADELNKISNHQVNVGDAEASLTLDGGSYGHGYHRHVRAAEEVDKLDATVAAIGNNMNVDVNGRHFAEIKNRQYNYADDMDASAFIKVEDTEDLSATVAAIGNSANISMDETSVKEIDSKQLNFGDATARAYISQEGDSYQDDTRPGDMDVTVAAIGNSLSVEADNVTRHRLRGGDIDSVQINDTYKMESDLKLRAEKIHVEATVASIGNSFSAELTDRLSQDIDVFQKNRAKVEADADVRVGRNNNRSIDVTVAAIGNSANIAVDGDRRSHNAYGDVEIKQLNLSRRSTADLELGSYGGADKIEATSAAMGNSAVVELSGDFFQNIRSEQFNKADARAEMDATISDATDVEVDLTAAAIGNSLSIKIGE